MEETMNQEPTTETPNASTEPKVGVDLLVEQLVGIGSEWAVFGLHCGTTALEKSARTLRLAARTLSTLSRSIEEKGGVKPSEEEAAPADEGAPETTVTADPSKL